MSKYIIKDTTLTDIADAIRTRNSTTDLITVNNMASTIGDIVALIDYENNNITSISDYAFYNADWLKSVSFPNATSIGKNAFRLCDNLTTVDLPLTTSIGEYAFYGCNKLELAQMSTVNRIDKYAFMLCTSLKNIDLSVCTYVGVGAFYDTNLTIVKMPKAMNILGQAFSSCKNLTNVIIQSNTYIDTAAFSGCSNLSAVVLSNTTSVSSISQHSVFGNTPIANGTGYIYVPDSLVNSYKTATTWSTYASQIKPISEYTGEL